MVNFLKKIFITREKIGYKFGEFAFTKKYTPKTKILKKGSRK
jgi:ribosomal protein S19